MEREQRNQRSEADDQQNGDAALCRRVDPSCGGKHFRNAESSHKSRQPHQPCEQNQRPKSQIDRNLPSNPPAVTTAKDADHQESRDQRQLVEGVEEKKIGRNEGTDRAGGDQQRGTVVKLFTADRSFSGKHGCKRHNHREDHHHQAHPVHVGEAHAQRRPFQHRHGKVPEIRSPAEEGKCAEKQIESTGRDGREARGSAEKYGDESQDRQGDEKREHDIEGRSDGSPVPHGEYSELAAVRKGQNRTKTGFCAEQPLAAPPDLRAPLSEEIETQGNQAGERKPRINAIGSES